MSQELKPIKGSGWLWFLGVVIIVLGISLALIPDSKNLNHQSLPTAPAAISQQWELCWEKKPDYEGKTATRYKCLPARVETRTESHIIISYSYSGGRGVQEGTSTDGHSYDGTWRDTGGWGKWHLRFVSPDTAFGWSDDAGGGKGEKAPTVLRKK